MAEYIERDEAVRKAIDACIKVVGHGITQFDAVDIADEIEAIPAADVVEVRHGEWIECDWVCIDEHGGVLCHPNAGFCCSECHHAFKKELLWKDNYCPNCGADMRGEKN